MKLPDNIGTLDQELERYQEALRYAGDRRDWEACDRIERRIGRLSRHRSRLLQQGASALQKEGAKLDNHALLERFVRQAAPLIRQLAELVPLLDSLEGKTDNDTPSHDQTDGV